MLYEVKRPVLPLQALRVYFKFVAYPVNTSTANLGAVQVALAVGQELFGPYPSEIVTSKTIWELRREKPHLSPKKIDRRLSEIETKLLSAWRDLLDEGQVITGDRVMNRANLLTRP